MNATFYTTILQDSILRTNHPKDTILLKSDSSQSNELSGSLQVSADSIQKPVIKKIHSETGLITEKQPEKEVKNVFTEIKQKTLQGANHTNSDSLTGIHKKNNRNIFHYFQSHDKNFDYKPQALWEDLRISIAEDNELNFTSHIYLRSQLNWTLIIGILSVALLIGLKSYYGKFVTLVINTMVNFQLADKLFREKNILVRRAFFMLNLNYLMVFSLFILLFFNFFQVSITENQFVNYLIILGVVFCVLVFRLILYYLTAFIFEWTPAVNQQIHSIYLINKNIGLLLLPIVFAVIYTSSDISGILIYIGLGLIIIASFYKLLRGFQIILRNGILLFYAILYLCTLELLPWVIGSKLIIYLR